MIPAIINKYNMPEEDLWLKVIDLALRDIAHIPSGDDRSIIEDLCNKEDARQFFCIGDPPHGDHEWLSALCHYFNLSISAVKARALHLYRRSIRGFEDMVEAMEWVDPEDYYYPAEVCEVLDMSAYQLRCALARGDLPRHTRRIIANESFPRGKRAWLKTEIHRAAAAIKEAKEAAAAETPRMLDMDAVAELVGLPRRRLITYMATGRFPRPHRLGPNLSLWNESAVKTWMEERA